MTYYNRKPQLLSTLKTIAQSSVKEKEVVIVDDASSGHHVIHDVPAMFDFPIKIKTVVGRKWSAPSILFNQGFAMSSGDILLIQNAENFHYGDVIAYAKQNTVYGTYLLFSCRSLPPNITPENLGDFMGYPRRRPELHWCASITRKDLQELNGFDERFSAGCDFDDDEFFERVKRKKMDIKILDESIGVLALHQHHDAVIPRRPDYHKKWAINKKLFQCCVNEASFRANPNKCIMP